MKSFCLISSINLILSLSCFALEEVKKTPDERENLTSASKSKGEGLSSTLKDKSIAKSIEGDSAHTKTMKKSQYLAGGALALFPGLGIGHAVQGRWSEIGWIFTFGQIISAGGLFAGVYYHILATLGGDPNPRYTSSLMFTGVYATLFSAFTALRIWEMVDAWNVTSNYKIVKRPKFQLSPLYTANYRDMSSASLGLSLKYNF